MLLEAGGEFLVAGRFGHFGQSRYELFLRAVEILQLVNVKVFECIKFHILFVIILVPNDSGMNPIEESKSGRPSAGRIFKD